MKWVMGKYLSHNVGQGQGLLTDGGLWMSNIRIAYWLANPHQTLHSILLNSLLIMPADHSYNQHNFSTAQGWAVLYPSTDQAYEWSNTQSFQWHLWVGLLDFFVFFLVLVYCVRVLKLMLHITFLWGVMGGSIGVVGWCLNQRWRKWRTNFCWSWGEVASLSTQINSVLSCNNCLTTEYHYQTSSFFVGWSLKRVGLCEHVGGGGGGRLL